MEVWLDDGRSASIRVPEPGDAESVYVLSMERSGSSIFWEIIRDLLSEESVPFCEPYEDLFEQGLTHVDVPLAKRVELLSRDGYVFGVIRDPTEFNEEPWFRERSKLVLVRDPRDVVVSLYFSMLGSHRTTGGSIEADHMSARAVAQQGMAAFVHSEYAKNIFAKYAVYCDLISHRRNTVLFRYEDVIYDKRQWVADIAMALKLHPTPAQIARIAAAYDEFPAEEQRTRNIRQVRPGSWREHLDCECLTKIEELFGKVMIVLGYPPEALVHEEIAGEGIHYLRRLGQRFQTHYDTMHRLAIEGGSKARRTFPIVGDDGATRAQVP